MSTMSIADVKFKGAEEAKLAFETAWFRHQAAQQLVQETLLEVIACSMNCIPGTHTTTSSEGTRK